MVLFFKLAQSSKYLSADRRGALVNKTLATTIKSRKSPLAFIFKKQKTSNISCKHYWKTRITEKWGILTQNPGFLCISVVDTGKLSDWQNGKHEVGFSPKTKHGFYGVHYAKAAVESVAFVMLSLPRTRPDHGMELIRDGFLAKSTFIAAFEQVGGEAEMKRFSAIHAAM